MSSKATDCMERILRELTNVGITPDISRTGAGHMRIRWKANGNLRSIVTSSTPSEVRTALNARAQIRALLRADGMLDAKPKDEPVLAKALVVPQPREPDNARFERLENDITALLDIVGALHTKLIDHGIKLGDDIPAPPPQPTYVVPEKKKRDSSWKHEFLLCLEYQAVPIGIITNRAGCTYGNASVRLTQLKKEGLVENVGRGLWRKRAPNGNGAHHG